MRYLILLLLSFNVYGDTVSWVAPTEREDNTPLPLSEIAGYNVYSGGEKLNTNLVDTLFYVIDRVGVDLTVNVTAVDTEGRESAYSVSATIPKLITRPKAPTGLSVSR